MKNSFFMIVALLVPGMLLAVGGSVGHWERTLAAYKRAGVNDPELNAWANRNLERAKTRQNMPHHRNAGHKGMHNKAMHRGTHTTASKTAAAAGTTRTTGTQKARHMRKTTGKKTTRPATKTTKKYAPKRAKTRVMES